MPLAFGCCRRSWLFAFPRNHPWKTSRREFLPKYLQSEKWVTSFSTKSNILVDQDGRALLTDFGSPSVAWTHQDASKETARWCAPEVLGDDPLSGTRPTFASDVFSFGMVVFEVTLTPPGEPVLNGDGNSI